MIQYLLDTNVLSEAIKTTPNPRVMEKLERHQHEIATAAIVWHELQFGCMRLPVSRKRAVIQTYLDEVVSRGLAILPYDASAAEWHAEQRARLAAAGTPPSFVDGQIAAIAVVSRLTLVTRNIDDFQWFSDVKAQNWHQ